MLPARHARRSSATSSNCSRLRRWRSASHGPHTPLGQPLLTPRCCGLVPRVKLLVRLVPDGRQNAVERDDFQRKPNRRNVLDTRPTDNVPTRSGDELISQGGIGGSTPCGGFSKNKGVSPMGSTVISLDAWVSGGMEGFAEAALQSPCPAPPPPPHPP